MLLVNLTGSVVSTPELGGLEVAPGATVEIDDGYCRPRTSPNGARLPSIVEMVAAGLTPMSDAPVPPPVVPEAQPDVPQGVAEMMAAGLVEEPKKRSRRKGEE